VLPVEDRAAAQLHDQLSPDFPGVSSASCPALAPSQWRRLRDVRPHT
jgi:hypothetical protein